MAKVLRIDASARLEGSDSRRLTDVFMENWTMAHPQDEVVKRDVGAEPPPHFDELTLTALSTPEPERGPSMVARAELADTLLQEFLEAEVVVIGTPMYNFTIPSTLKAWIDHIARAGVTFRYTPEGPQGLAGGKKVYVIATRGGLYTDSPLDMQEPYLRNVMAFLGIDDVEFVRAEGLNIDAEARARALTDAEARIGSVLMGEAA